MAATYSLVEFFEEQNEYGCPLAIVPSNWLDGEKCRWPKKNLNPNWILKRRMPEEDWDTVAVRILYTNEQYSKVKEKEEEAFDNSDVRTTTDEEHSRPGKRKRHQRRLTSSSSEEEVTHEVQAISTPLPQPPRKKVTPVPLYCGPLSVATSSRQVPGPSTRYFAETSEEPTHSLRDTFSADQMESYFRRTFVLLEKIRSELADQREMIENLSQQLRTSSGVPAPTSRPSLPEGFDFPLTTVVDLKRLDAHLQDDEARANMILYAAGIGGREPKDKARRILQRLLTNALAMLYNMTGSKSKESFNALKNFKLVVVGGVTNNDLAVTEKEVDSFITSWLASARDRDGGRARRTPAPVQQPAINIGQVNE